MDNIASFVNIIKKGVEREILVQDSSYNNYYPKESYYTELQRNLYDIWYFWLKIKKRKGTFYFLFEDKKDEFEGFLTCIEYRLTKNIKLNLQSLGIDCPKTAELMYVGVGENVSRQNLNEQIVESLFSYNSLHLLYFGKPLKYRRYCKNLDFYKKRIKSNNFDPSDFVIVSSGILGIYGMREPTDIDMVTIEPNYGKICDELIDCHHHVLHTYEITADELIMNPNKYVYWDGIKFAALDVVYKACENRKEETKKLDGYFVRVIWGEENPSIYELTQIRVRHYYLRTTREWKKHHYAWKKRTKNKIIFCIKLPYLVVRKIYRIIRNKYHEEDKD